MTPEEYTLFKLKLGTIPVASAPTKGNYKLWYEERRQRTVKAMEKKKPIHGREIRKQNLSMKTLYDGGWTLDVDADTMKPQ